MPVKNYDIIGSLEELSEYVDRLIEEGETIGFDIETGYTGPDTPKGAVRSETSLLAGISFTNSLDWARYVPLGHDLAENVDNQGAARLFWKLFNAIPGVAHNLRFELRNLSRWFRKWLSDDPIFGADVRAAKGYFKYLSCTMLQSYMLAQTQFHGLKYLVKEIFGHEMTNFVDLFPNVPKNKEKSLRFNVLELEPNVVEYACEDSVWCLALHQKNYDKVKDRMLFQVEMHIMRMLCDAEDFGIQMDWELINAKSIEAQEFLEATKAEIMKDMSAELGTEVSINLASPKQLADVLFDKMGLVSTVYTAGSIQKEREGTGEKKMSTGALAMMYLAKESPIVQKILVWKTVNTLRSRFLEKTDKEFRYAPDDRVHPNHIQASLPAGRFAVSDPPYQQWPKKPYNFTLSSGESFQFKFKDAVIAPPGYYILGFDLSMAELRILAGEANEKALLEAFANKVDVHATTASVILNKNLVEVSDAERSKYGKIPNFSLTYGLSAGSLAQRNDMSIDEAEDIHEQFFAKYASLNRWINDQKKRSKSDGYIVSKFGRLQTIWEFQSPNWKIRNKGERIGVNGVAQGGVADYMKTATVRADKIIKERGWADKVLFFMNIHDASEYYVHESLSVEEVIQALEPAVNYPVTGWPRMKPDWHAGKTWGSVDAYEYNEDGSVTKVVKKAKAVVSEEDRFSEEELDEGSVTPIDLYTLKPTNGTTLQLQELPEQEEVAKFKTYLGGVKGNTPVTFKTPQGSVKLKVGINVTTDEFRKAVLEFFPDARVW